MNSRSISKAKPTSPAFAIVFGGTTILALLGGAMLALLDPYIGILLIVALLGIAVVVRKEVLLYFCLAISLLVSGLAQLYFPPLSFVRWLVPITATLLLIHLLPGLNSAREESRPMPGLLRWAMLFLLVAVFSSVLNWRGGFALVQGTKLYLQLWGLMFAVALASWRPVVLDGVLKVLLVLGFVQLPFVLHQYFFIVPEREGLWQLGVVPLDVVTGTMGAERFGSGKNSVLSAYLISILAVLIACWREKAVRTSRLLLSAPFLLLPLFLNESKFALVLLLAVLGYIFRKDVVHHPVRFFFILVAAISLAFGLLATYSSTFGKGRSIAETVEYTIDSNVGSKGHAGMLLNRWTVLTHWMSRHGIEDVPGTLIGHGLGASHESAHSALGAVGEASLADTRFGGYGIGLTAVSSILWDTGIIGLTFIIAMFVSAFLAARRLSVRHASIPWRKGTFDGLQAVIIAIGLMLFHSNYFVLDPALQTLTYFIFGYIGYWSIKSTVEPRHSPTS